MRCALATIDEFIEKGFVHLKRALPRPFVDEWWAPRRQWLDENDADVPWAQVGSHLYFPRRRSFAVVEVAPKIAEIVQALVGKNAIAQDEIRWGDGFVVARPHLDHSPVGQQPWHKDGFFRHYLDSPEIGLVGLVLWTDVQPESGPTAIAQNSVGVVAAALRDHPEGLDPDAFESLLPNAWPEIPATGEAGDVYLMHPFLLHARRPNRAKTWRAITNPAVPLRHSFQFGKDGSEPTPVEKAVLQSLGCNSIDYRRTRERAGTVPSASAGPISDIRSWLDRKITAWEQARATSHITR